MQGLSERGLIHLIVAGAKERRQRETQRQIYEKLREMEAEEKARRAQQQHLHREKRHRAYSFSIALKRGAAQTSAGHWSPDGGFGHRGELNSR